MIHAAEKLAVALDVPTLEDALRLSAALAGKAGLLKVGLELFTAHGAAAVHAASSFGSGVFLDLKIHDIPRTAAAAVASAATLGARCVTLHALGGPKMIEAARRMADAAGASRPLLLAVTVLTSHGPEDLEAIGLGGSARDHVVRLARMAIDSGADGLVCSAEEVATLRGELGMGPMLVTPGIRPAGAAKGDQVRIATPADAIRGGSDVLVVGRPIVAAPDPAIAADEILAEIGAALGER